MKLKVSSTGKRVNFRGPHEYCGGFNTRKEFYGQISNLRVSSAGRFKGSRNYSDRIVAARGSSEGDLDLVLDWNISVSGRFTTSLRASGSVSYHMRQHLEHTGTHTPYDPDGDGQANGGDCGKHSGTWKAKR